MENKVKKAADIVASLTGIAPKRVSRFPTSPNYSVYLDENSASPDELKRQRAVSFRGAPLISLMLAASVREEADLSNTVLSVTAQTYPNWELILVVNTGCSGCGKFSSIEKVKTIILDGAYEELLSSAEEVSSGEYLMLIKAGDILAPDLLFRMIQKISYEPDIDLVYADSDVHDEFGRRCSPVFKPSFSPVTEIAFDYIRRPLLVSRMLHEKAGGTELISTFGYHRYVVNCCKRARHAANIPRVLLSEKESKEISITDEPFELDSRLEAVPGLFEGSFQICGLRKRDQKVSIIIGDAADCRSLRRCIEAVDSDAVSFDYKLIVSVCSDCPKELKSYLDALKKNKAAHIVYSEPGLPVPALLNAGAAKSFSNYLIFLSSGVEILSPDFIERLIDPIKLKTVAVCGGKLFDCEGLLLHTGSVIGMEGLIGSPYSGTRDDMNELQKCFFTSIQRNVTAVSGAFMAISSEDFADMGMFDETFTKVGWDADLCIRAIKKGRQVVFTPYAKTSAFDYTIDYSEASEKNLERCRDVFREYLLNGDPYYSPNLGRRYSVPQLLIDPKLD